MTYLVDFQKDSMWLRGLALIRLLDAWNTYLYNGFDLEMIWTQGSTVAGTVIDVFEAD